MGFMTQPRIMKKICSLSFLLMMSWCPNVFAEDGDVTETPSEPVVEETTATAPETSEAKNAFHLGGYIRTWASMNLQDVKDTKENDRWDFSMLRGSLLLDADQKIDRTPIGPISFKVIGRLDREIMTNYLRRLQDLNRSGVNSLGSTGGPGSNLKEDVYDAAQLREWYVDMQPIDRLSLRIGKQQVVWGETDFFRAMDIVHGYDYRWRFFMEPENEELRKPLIMLNAKIQVPELKGALQVLFRPGLDRDNDLGNTYDVTGGRFALASLRGLDFHSFFVNSPVNALGFPNGTPLVVRNMRHPDGDVSDPTYGVRWTGAAGPIGYSLAYLKTFSNDPVDSTSTAIGGQPLNGVEPARGALIEIIHPKIDVFGLTLNGYVPLVDAVFSTELAFIRDQPFNASNSSSDIVSPTVEALLGLPINSFDFYVPGTTGGSVVKKNVLKTMLRMDKSFALTQQLLGTGKPGFFSVQMFDEWVLGYRKSDNLIRLLTFGAPKREHSTLLTSILMLSYRNETINPMLAVGWDMSYQGTFFFPSCEFVLGNHWRARLEANFFFNQHEKQVPTASIVPGLNQRPDERAAGLMDYFANNDQLLLRLTYQF